MNHYLNKSLDVQTLRRGEEGAKLSMALDYERMVVGQNVTFKEIQWFSLIPAFMFNDGENVLINHSL